LPDPIEYTSRILVEPIEVLLVTTKQASDALQVCERTIFNLLASGQLRSVKVGGSRRIFTDDLRAFARAGVAEITKKAGQ
jgi:excisionase family DNA binding protein